MITQAEWIAFIVYALATAWDAYTTVRGLKGGATEGGSDHAIGKRPSTRKLIAKDIVLTGFVLWALHALAFGIWLAYLLASINAYAAWRNSKTRAYRRG